MKRNIFHASALAAAISLMPLGALAAGLGKVTVLSPLGQPLRAEVEVTASREEMASMTAKVAPASAFQQAGIDYAPAMTGIRVVVDKRPNGQPFLKVTSDRAINDPFLDVLLELTWSSGRMMREYTMLLDPPEALQKATPAPVTAPEVKVPTVAQAPAKPVAAPAGASAPVPAATPAKAAPAKAAPAEATPAPAKPAGEQGTHTVKRGETLSKIAGETKPEGVSLDQMLVALLQANKDAFDGGNMNRLKTGKILSVPDQAAASSVSTSEARKIVLSQSSDFNAYRQKLAGTVVAAPAAKETGVKQEAAGKISAKVEEKPAAAAPSKDKLEVSRTEAAKEAKAVQGRIAALEEDLVSREKALKEANSRIADLEKNLTDLKKLAELKSQAAAQLQQQAQAAKAAPAPAPAPVPEVKKPEPAPVAAAPVEIPKAPEKPAEAAAPVEPPKPVEVAPPPASVESPKPVEPPQAPEPVKKPVPPPEEPSFIDDNAALVYGGGGVLVLLLGYLGYSAMRRKREGELSPTTSRITEGDLMANSVFGATGGQSVDTGASIQTDFSQSNLTSIDADEGVDPVAEADVYMAYGRDAQAEEILIDALKSDPARHAIHLKLLEIYSGRKSAKQFESLAADLYGQTSGAGPDWEKAAAMGRELDPENPLYGARTAEAEQEAGEAARAAEDLVVPPSEVQKLRDTVTMPGQFGAMAAAATAAAEAEPLAPMDFDLELPQAAEAATDIAAAPPSAPMTAPVDLNLDIGLPSMEGAEMDATAPMGVRMPEPSSAKESGGLDFEFDLGIEGGDGTETVATSVSQPVPAMDLSSIDLNLNDTSTEPDVLASAASDQDDPDVATKIELAQAYEEMGDKEGARELLQEVAQEGSARQQEIARSKLAQLGA